MWQGSLVSKVTGCGLEDHGLITGRAQIFLLTIISRLALGLRHPFVQWVKGAVSLGVMWVVCEAKHSPPSSTQV